MERYISENCFKSIDWQSSYIENVEVRNNNLYLTFEAIELIKEHPLNPFDTEVETNAVVLVFYDYEVLESGYYDCSLVEKMEIDFEKDCSFVPIPLLKMIDDFTIVTEDLKEKNGLSYEQSFEGWAWKFGEETWGYFKIKYKRMEMRWNTFND